MLRIHPKNHWTRFIRFMLLALSLLTFAATQAFADQGSITIEQEGAGATYDAYQLFRADISSDDKATHVAWPSDDMKDLVLAFLDTQGYGDWLSTNHPGNDQRDRAQNASEFTAQMIADSKTDDIAATKPRTTQAKSFANELAQALATGTSVTPLQASSGNTFTAEKGYWLFVTNDNSPSEAGTSPVYVPLGGSTTTIHDKSAMPTVQKELKEDSTGAWGKVADANVVQSLDYRLTAQLPTNFGSFETYTLVFEDALSEGLDLTIPEGKSLADALVVKVAGQTVAIDGTAVKAGYQNRKLKVEFTDLKSSFWDSFNCSGGDSITVEYQSHMNENASLGEAGNTNGVNLKYTKDPVTLQTGTIERAPETKVFSYKLMLRKFDAQTAEPLAGASFTLQETDGQMLYVQENGSLAPDAFIFTTDDAGTLEIPGIDEGSYLLRETQAPSGYNTLQHDIQLQISSTLDDSALKLVDLTARATVEDGADYVKVASVDATSGTVALDVNDDKWLSLPLTGLSGYQGVGLGGALFATIASCALRLRRRNVRH